MTQELLKILSTATSSGKVLSIKYHGRMQPGGATGDITHKHWGPKVRVQCLTSNAVGVFGIRTIELCDRPALSESGNGAVDSRTSIFVLLPFHVPQSVLRMLVNGGRF